MEEDRATHVWAVDFGSSSFYGSVKSLHESVMALECLVEFSLLFPMTCLFHSGQLPDGREIRLFVEANAHLLVYGCQ